MLTTANHGLSGRAGSNFIMASVQSRKKYAHPEKNTACFVTDSGRPPAEKTVLNLQKVKPMPQGCSSI